MRLTAYGDPVEGTPFGRYRLIELLGRGGMGEVWRAHDTEIDRVVALKMLLPHFAQDRTFEQRFRREARAAARLDDPHVVPIYDVGEFDGRLYVTMRLIDGHNLQNLLEDGPLEPERAVGIIEDVAKALHAAHKVGLVHRDVKPSNILLGDDDFAYLIDFGIARAMEETRLTGTGNPLGTFHYIAPERLGDQPSDDSRTDIYALACVLYECLTGHPPFAGDTMAGLVAAHLNTPPPQPSTSQPNVPKQVDKVIATGMAKDPDQRYATTVELASAAHDAITTPIPAPAQNLRTPPAFVTNPAPPTPATEPATRQQPADLNLAATQQRPPGRPPVPQPRPADRPPPQIGTPPTQSWWRRQRRQVKLAIIAGVVVILAAAGITAYLVWPHPSPSQTQTAQPAPPSGQTVLPFSGLSDARGVAVDTAGSVYVADAGSSRVVKLAAGSTTQTELPFAGLKYPDGVAVDTAGDVFVTDTFNNRVLKLAAGSTAQTELSITGLGLPVGVAVDAAGNVYVSGAQGVLKLAAGAATPTELPFTNLLGENSYVAVDTAGNVYVADGNNKRVLKLAAGSSTQAELPFSGLKDPEGVAVDTAGNVYLVDKGNNRVLKLAAGASSPSEIPFSGLKDPFGVAVDTAGDVYVADRSNDRVVKLPAS
jgi:serine/threonine-protein kinase